MRTDPTDNGGLFIGRRPGTAPVRYRALPERGSKTRRAVDAGVAAALLAVMTLVNLSFWGPLPAAWLWVGSQVQYRTGSVSVGIFAAFAGLMATLLVGLMLLRRMDHGWVLVRRAAGHDQRGGMLGRIFPATCVVGTMIFVAWLLLFSGASLAPVGITV